MSVVDEIKQRTDIVDLVSQYVTLKRAGRDYMALCPFHSERTPSFHVSPARQTWHCFGACGTGGDVFAFIMKKDECDFRQALTLLAERSGVTLDQRHDPRADAHRARLYEINETAAAFFQAALRDETGAFAAGAQSARDYVADRHLAPRSVESFQIGYAPNRWDALAAHLEARRFTREEMLTSGLAVEGERGPYDRFRHRLMFPIRDERGRVAGFGGRLLPGEALGAGDSQPKYVNTPQSPVFDKGATLYGLDLAKEYIRNSGSAVIVEGYMDAIAAHEHGSSNVVASMGTALTEQQFKLIRRFARTIIVVLDGDEAGTQGMQRGYEAAKAALDAEAVPGVTSSGLVRFSSSLDADVRMVTLPPGQDVDDVLRSGGTDWDQLVAHAARAIDFMFDSAVARRDLSQPFERAALVKDVAPLLHDISDRIVQANYLQRLARIAQVDEPTVRMEVRAARGRGPARASGPGLPARSQVPHDAREEFCLALLFRYPRARSEGVLLEGDLFGHSENRALFETWVDWADGESFGESLTPDLRPQYERITQLALPVYDDDTVIRALRDAVRRIEQQRLHAAKRASAAVIAEIGANGGAQIAQRARDAWHAGVATDDGSDEAVPAAAFVEDMEVGLKVHQRLLEQHNAERPAR
ncbi:MAG TPA: DNA primase [Dehalococcoidia bacterium]|nr:DNA primase [Dehalococcoidia bacterium]